MENRALVIEVSEMKYSKKEARLKPDPMTPAGHGAEHRYLNRLRT